MKYDRIIAKLTVDLDKHRAGQSHNGIGSKSDLTSSLHSIDVELEIPAIILHTPS